MGWEEAHSGTYRHICQPVSAKNSAAETNGGKQTEDEPFCKAHMPRQRVPWSFFAVWARLVDLAPVLADAAAVAVAVAEPVCAAGAGAVSALDKTGARQEAPKMRFDEQAGTAPEG